MVVSCLFLFNSWWIFDLEVVMNGGLFLPCVVPSLVCGDAVVV